MYIYIYIYDMQLGCIKVLTKTLLQMHYIIHNKNGLLRFKVYVEVLDVGQFLTIFFPKIRLYKQPPNKSLLI